MKVLVQKVLEASLTVDGKLISAIKKGYVLFIGVEPDDTKAQADFLAKKTANLRIFTDENDKMNLSICDVSGEILAISQFTLAADVSRGNRPGFESAAKPEIAKPLYEYFVEQLRQYQIAVQTGIFGADMKVALINDGPCTFWLTK